MSLVQVGRPDPQVKLDPQALKDHEVNEVKVARLAGEAKPVLLDHPDQAAVPVPPGKLEPEENPAQEESQDQLVKQVRSNNISNKTIRLCERFEAANMTLDLIYQSRAEPVTLQAVSAYK